MPRYVRQDGQAVPISDLPFNDASGVTFSDSGLAVVTGISDVQSALEAVDAALEDRPTQAQVEDYVDQVGTMVHVGRFQPESSGDNISFSVPSNVTSLHLRGLLRSPTSGVTQAASLRFNFDSGSNYFGTELRVSEGTVTGIDRSAATAARLTVMPGSDVAPTGSFAHFTADINGLFASVNAVMTSRGGFRSGGSTRIHNEITTGWNSTDAVTSIVIFGGFNATSRVDVYGYVQAP